MCWLELNSVYDKCVATASCQLAAAVITAAIAPIGRRAPAAGSITIKLLEHSHFVRYVTIYFCAVDTNIFRCARAATFLPTLRYNVFCAVDTNIFSLHKRPEIFFLLCSRWQGRVMSICVTIKGQ